MIEELDRFIRVKANNRFKDILLHAYEREVYSIPVSNGLDSKKQLFGKTVKTLAEEKLRVCCNKLK